MGRNLTRPNFIGGATCGGVEVITPGGIVASGVTQGNRYYVRPYNGADSNDGKSPSTAFKTLKKARDTATANQNDIVYLMGENNTATKTFDYLATALDWNKDAVHLIGIGCGAFLGQRAGLRNAITGTGVAIEDLFTVSANNCLIENIEVFQGDATFTATTPRACVVSGMRNHFVNCQLSGIGDTGNSMDVALASSLSVTGDENYFENCYIGLDTCLRATCLGEVRITGKRNVFEDCFIESYTSLSTFKAVIMTSVDRFTFFKNTIFSAIQNITSAVAPTGAILNTTPNGNAIILGGGAYGYADVSTLDDTKTLMLAHHGYTGTAGAELVGIGQGVDA